MNKKETKKELKKIIDQLSLINLYRLRAFAEAILKHIEKGENK